MTFDKSDVQIQMLTFDRKQTFALQHFLMSTARVIETLLISNIPGNSKAFLIATSGSVESETVKNLHIYQNSV